MITVRLNLWLGFVEATFLLSQIYALQKQDMVKSIELLKEAANKGLSVAQHNLGSMYFEGVNTTINDQTVKMYLVFSYFLD